MVDQFVSETSYNDAAPACSDDCQQEDWNLELFSSALEQRHLAIGRKARELREAKDGWMKYAQSLEAKIKILEKKVQRNQNKDDLPTTSSSAKAQPSQTEDGARAADEETQDGSDETARLPTIPTNMEAKPEIAIKEEPSSDPPVIVSERPVRKRKHRGDNAGTPVRPRRIKNEHSPSSDPVITAEVPVFRPHESLDLDEEEQRIPTPRKLRDWEQRLLREGREEQGDEDASGGRHLGEERPAKQQGKESAQDSDAPPEAPNLSTHKSPSTRKNRVPDIKPGWTIYSGVADVAEETCESFYSPEPPRSRKRSARQPAAPGRLYSLLHNGSPDDAAGILPSASLRRAKVKIRVQQEDTENIPPDEEGEEDHDGFIKSSGAENPSSEAPSRRRPQGKDSFPGPSRLRDRPLAELRPEDFKVNPKFNNGYDYAFDEVVRRREERAELSGCTDPNCCGKKFQAMARSELSAAGPTLLSHTSQVELMENYLGHEAHQLIKMRVEERQEIWLKAKTQDLANRYGRHRHRFARRPSPPGFWNPDFPSTQEIRASKEEAERREREVVEERWREAMRGGKWLFRDE
ncbi:hypothetical protein VTH82DRAFT_5856 [Thermothelomyces myriococcoides]